MFLSRISKLIKKQICVEPLCSYVFSARPVADLGGGGWGGCIPPHQPKSNDFGRKISLYFE